MRTGPLRRPRRLRHGRSDRFRGSDTGGPDTGDTGPVDGDGDGYLDDVDCDDTEPTAHPGATDVCDGVDRDCDGVDRDCDGALVGEGEVTQLADIGFSPDRGMGCLAASSRLPLGGTIGPDEVAPCWEHDDDVSRVVDLAVADIDGSGIPDLVLSARPYEARAPIPLYVLPELALPWGDATRW